MKKIRVKWAKPEDLNEFNFGDDLNPYIIKALSGLDVEYIHFGNTRLNSIKQFLNGIMNTPASKLWYIHNFIYSFFSRYYIICIGSILQWYSSSRCIVWGAGIISENDPIRNSKFLAVRGKYTLSRIKELGYTAPVAIGDPALLLPLVYNNVVVKKYKLGIIPHVSQFEYFQTFDIPNDVLLINLNSKNIEKIIDNIRSCEYTISTSLHGIIVSHAYNIKSLWYASDEITLAGDNVKYYDYFSSVDISNYDPFKIGKDYNLDSSSIIDEIERNSNKNLPLVAIETIQKTLLKVSPFTLLKKYQR